MFGKILACVLLILFIGSYHYSATADTANNNPVTNKQLSPPSRNCKSIADDIARLQCYDSSVIQGGNETIQDEESPWVERSLQTQQSWSNRYTISPYKPNYLLPIAYNDTPNIEPFETLIRPGETMDKTEAKFQISFQLPVARDMFGTHVDSYFAYTQVAYWQVYNTEASAPFRETNYEPEVGLSVNTEAKYFNINFRQLRFGFVHQSNGRTGALSRSWNRVFAHFVMDWRRLAMVLRPWIRIKEESAADDNPDIGDYMGNFEWLGIYKKGRSTFGLTWRNTLDSNNRGALQLDWSHPVSSRHKSYVQLFNGYGESLLDYNHRSRRISIGIMITDWL